MKKSALITAAFALVLTVVGVVSAHAAQAADLSGWAWSSNIGWISFNSSDAGAGGGPYKVSVDSSGNMSGYAWSPNVGWLSFNSADLTGCNGTAAPTINLTTGAVTGWARFTAGTGRTDGWDGCLELSNPSSHASPDLSGNGGVTMNPSTGVFTGYAWGGNVVGWVDFTPSTSNPGVTCQNNCSPGSGSVSITGTCSATPASIPEGGSVNFQLSNITDSDAHASGSYTFVWATGVGNISGTNPYTYSSYPNSAASYSTGVTVTDSDGNSNTISCGNVTVTNNAPSASIGLVIGSPNNISTSNMTAFSVSQGDPFALGWNNSLNLSNYTCGPIVMGTGAPGTWGNGWGTTPSGTISYPTDTTVPKGTYTFSIYCQNIAGGADAQSNAVKLVVTQSTETEF